MSGAITAVAVAVGADAATAAAIAATTITIGTDTAIGAALGTVTAAITGGDIGKGALFGAIGGAVTGGIGEAIGGVAGEAGGAAEAAASEGGATASTAGATLDSGIGAGWGNGIADISGNIPQGAVNGLAAAPDMSGAFTGSNAVTGAAWDAANATSASGMPAGYDPTTATGGVPAPGAVNMSPLPAPDGAATASSNGLLQPVSDTGLTPSTTPSINGVNGDPVNINGPSANLSSGNDSLVTNASDGAAPLPSTDNLPNMSGLPQDGPIGMNTPGSPTYSPEDTSGSIFGKNGWIAQNEPAVKLGGEVAKGLGTGLLQQNQQENLISAYQRLGQNQLDLAAANRAALSANYAPSGSSNSNGLLSYNQTFNPAPALTPTPTFTPSAAGGQWAYSPSAGKVVYQVNKTS